VSRLTAPASALEPEAFVVTALPVALPKRAAKSVASSLTLSAGKLTVRSVLALSLTPVFIVRLCG